MAEKYNITKKIKCKVVFDSHEIFTENLGIVSSFFWRTFWKIVEKHIIKKVDSYEKNQLSINL